MDRSIFKGAISIGGFVIPMRVVKATSEHDVRFHEYHTTDMGRVGRSKPCKACGTVLTEADITKGVEVSKGSVISFTKEELENLPIKSAKNIEIDRFVGTDELNPLMFDAAYYVLPDEIGQKAFELFVEGLKKARKVAIGKIAMRQREHICAIFPHGTGLMLNTLHYYDEIRNMPQVPKAQLLENEVELINQVIKKHSKPFEHAAYVDEYTDAIQALIDAKLEGKPIPVAQGGETKEPVDIVAALKGLL